MTAASPLLPSTLSSLRLSSLLLLFSLLSHSATAELNITGCPGYGKLQDVGEDVGLWELPACYCDQSTLPHARPGIDVAVRCILLPHVANLTSAINAVHAAHLSVHLVFLSGFNFHPVPNGLPPYYFAELGATNISQLEITLCERDEVTLHPQALAGLQDSLRHIQVTDCYMPHVPTLTLTSLTYSPTLTLTYSLGYRSQPTFQIPEAFQNLTSLEVLNLRTSGADILRADSFIGLPNLKDLDLSRNRIDHMQVGYKDRAMYVRTYSVVIIRVLYRKEFLRRCKVW